MSHAMTAPVKQAGSPHLNTSFTSVEESGTRWCGPIRQNLREV
jgi:hypothetical protein